MNGIDSDFKPQTAGIRQGCPLSPYLFCLVMGALFADVKAELNTPRQQQPIDGIHFSEILFADDTLIFGANTHCVNVLLHAIEKHSAYSGLVLNYGNCVNLTANQKQSSVRFSPTGPAQGALVPRKKSALYLGTLHTDSFDNRAEISNRLGDCIATCNRLKLFWNKTNTSLKWNMQVFSSIVRSKLLYGLECIQLTDAELSSLNAFQNKSLRRILKIPPTHIDRTQTNARMYETIRNHRLLGHILQARPSDPLAQVNLKTNGIPQSTPSRKRPGRPRADWLTETYKDALHLIADAGHLFNIFDAQQLLDIKQSAINRFGPFATR